MTALQRKEPVIAASAACNERQLVPALPTIAAQPPAVTRGLD